MAERRNKYAAAFTPEAVQSHDLLEAQRSRVRDHLRC